MISLRFTLGKHVFSKHGTNVVTSEDREYMNALAQCNPEEVDPLIMIHVLDASLHGHLREIFQSNSADIVVLVISIDSTLKLDQL